MAKPITSTDNTSISCVMHFGKVLPLLCSCLEVQDGLQVQTAGQKFRLDGPLCDLKLTADAARIPVPRYFVEERSQVIFGCNRLL